MRNDIGISDLSESVVCYRERRLHIAGHRNARVSASAVDIMAFSNVGAATLTVNGKTLGKAAPDDANVITWRDVPLQPGDNEIVVTAWNHCELHKTFQ